MGNLDDIREHDGSLASPFLIDPVSAKHSTLQVKTETKTAACACVLIAPELCSDRVHSYML